MSHPLPSPAEQLSEPLVHPHRLGVHPRFGGVDVVVSATRASAVDFCILTDGGPERRIGLHGPSNGLWHGWVPGVPAGTRYGLRVHGPWDPNAGLMHNPAKLLLDPYARAIAGHLQLRPEIYGREVDDNLHPMGNAIDTRDSAPFVPHGVVADSTPLAIHRPHVPWQDTVLYEAHVKGLTMNLPSVPPELRGTYAGMAHPATIEHLRMLGVTTVELLPIHAMATEPRLIANELTNYWGYNTLGFFAPNPDYATRAARSSGPLAVLLEVKGMVKLLHDAGIEVILDVVYNHTCEGGSAGPTLSWRGLDNVGYYLHDGGYPAQSVDMTGCGNTLDFRRARVVQLAVDSMRYWSDVVGVDGFRLDLASTLARGQYGFDRAHPFLTALRIDPSLSGRKLIAEPWDLGPGGWQTGSFPAPFAEWNDRFRNAVRTFWLTDVAALSQGRDSGGLRELATRLAGSADLFGGGEVAGARGPIASVNYVTAHDGFTLTDLTCYDHKHNAANGEGNRDGSDDNRSWNHGVEGPVNDLAIADAIVGIRTRSIRNMLATLLLAAGTPMITAGDEFGRSQGGNNNAYCQDNEISWVDWQLRPWQRDLLLTTAHLLHLRATLPVLRPTRFYTGATDRTTDQPDLAWYDADGTVLDSAAWHSPELRTLQMFRSGMARRDGSRDKDALIILHGGLDPISVYLTSPHCADWELRWDSDWDRPQTGRAEAEADGSAWASTGHAVTLEPSSIRIYTSPVT